MSDFKPTIDVEVFERLGTKLYSAIESAISETVANSYDAGASFSKIYHNGTGKFIAFLDDGSGMSRETMEKGLMNIAISDKDEKLINRIPMGKKGIGKLAPLYYAPYYDIYSKVDGEINGVRFSSQSKFLGEKVDGKSTFKELNYSEDLGTHENLLDSVESGTLVIVRETTKLLPFTTTKIQKFVANMKQRFIFPEGFDFKVTLNKINSSENGLNLNGNIKKVEVSDLDFQVNVTSDIDFENNTVNVEKLSSLISIKGGDMKVSGYFSLKSSITGLKAKGLMPRINIYSNNRLVMSSIPEEVTLSRSMKVSYISANLIIDDLTSLEKDDIISDNRESLDLKSDDPRIKGLVKYIDDKLSKDFIKIINDHSAKIKEEKDKAKNQELKENKKKLQLALSKVYSLANDEDKELIEEATKDIADSIGTGNLSLAKTLIISHNIGQADAANFVLNFLQYCGLEKGKNVKSILNTSSVAHGLKYEEKFLDRLNEILDGQQVTVIYCLSDKFFSSFFTAFEAGSIFSQAEKPKAFVVSGDGSFGNMKPPFNSEKTIPVYASLVSFEKVESSYIPIINPIQLEYFANMFSKILERFGIERTVQSAKEGINEFINKFGINITSPKFSEITSEEPEETITDIKAIK